MSWFRRNGARAESRRSANGNLDFMRGQVTENITSAVMMTDRNFVVTYVNQATRQLLSDHLDEFHKLWPNFKLESIVGTCIDTFHKNPARQHALLADPAKLPFKTEITVGSLKISLLVSAAFDRNGALCRQYPGMEGCHSNQRRTRA